jgi:hypothetical protein
VKTGGRGWLLSRRGKVRLDFRLGCRFQSVFFPCVYFLVLFFLVASLRKRMAMDDDWNGMAGIGCHGLVPIG